MHWWKSLDTKIFIQPNQEIIKVLKVLKPTIREVIYKTLGTRKNLPPSLETPVTRQNTSFLILYLVDLITTVDRQTTVNKISWKKIYLKGYFHYQDLKNFTNEFDNLIYDTY